MKLNLLNQIGLLGILVFFVYQVYAQPQNELLLPSLLHDSLATKATVGNKEATSIPLQSNLQKYVDRYLNENSEILDQIKERNSHQLKTIQQILVKRGLPEGLMYLAIVESELKNRATSGAGAAGIWQLMPETARSLGLQVNAKTDQRRHLYTSSVAAANHLKALYKQFDDWLLVVAAYNCGAGNVYKAIKQSGSREFWKLQRFLPAETSSHVKHFIATHFYYEDNGSMVTLTKKERTKFLASLNKVGPKETKQNTVTLPDSTIQPFNEGIIARQ
jgi:membrane-bound lytic murein transglycosylase D